MEAKDTVMPIEDGMKESRRIQMKRILNAQAEITFNLRTGDILKQLEEFNHRGLTITEAIELLQ